MVHNLSLPQFLLSCKGLTLKDKQKFLFPLDTSIPTVSNSCNNEVPGERKPSGKTCHSHQYHQHAQRQRKKLLFSTLFLHITLTQSPILCTAASTLLAYWGSATAEAERCSFLFLISSRTSRHQLGSPDKSLFSYLPWELSSRHFCLLHCSLIPHHIELSRVGF